jgi:hypothetical protein
VALDLTLVGVATFAVGLAILWYGLSSLARSFPISLIALVGGCAIAALGALPVITTDLGEAPDMAWPAAGFIGACLFKYGPGSPSRTRRRIVLSGIWALFVGSFVSGANRPVEGIVGVLPALVFWFSLARYRPASRWPTWLRRTAYSAMVVYAGSLYVWLRSAHATMRSGCFWVVRLPPGYSVHFPHPYDYYTEQLTRYLALVSLLLAVVCSVACLCVWFFDTFKVKALPAAKPLS